MRHIPDKCCLLLKAPFDLSKLIRIQIHPIPSNLPERARLPKARSLLHQDQDQAPIVDDDAALKQSQQELCEALNKSRLGGLLAVIPDHQVVTCTVFCLKVSPSFLDFEIPKNLTSDWADPYPIGSELQ